MFEKVYKTERLGTSVEMGKNLCFISVEMVLHQNEIKIPLWLGFRWRLLPLQLGQAAGHEIGLCLEPALSGQHISNMRLVGEPLIPGLSVGQRLVRELSLGRYGHLDLEQLAGDVGALVLGAGDVEGRLESGTSAAPLWGVEE